MNIIKSFKTLIAKPILNYPINAGRDLKKKSKVTAIFLLCALSVSTAGLFLAFQIGKKIYHYKKNDKIQSATEKTDQARANKIFTKENRLDFTSFASKSTLVTEKDMEQIADAVFWKQKFQELEGDDAIIECIKACFLVSKTNDLQKINNYIELLLSSEEREGILKTLADILCEYEKTALEEDLDEEEMKACRDIYLKVCTVLIQASSLLNIILKNYSEASFALFYDARFKTSEVYRQWISDQIDEFNDFNDGMKFFKLDTIISMLDSNEAILKWFIHIQNAYLKEPRDQLLACAKNYYNADCPEAFKARLLDSMNPNFGLLVAPDLFRRNSL